MLTDDFMINRESESNAFFLRRKKRVENLTRYFFVNVGSSIADFDNAEFIYAKGAKKQFSAIRHRLQGIDREI